MTDGARSTIFIQSLALTRFRNHDRFTVEADARPIAIHGRNGAGKTNILEAVSMLSPGRGLRGAKVEEIAGRPDPIGWSVRGAVEGPEGARRLSVSVDLRDGAKRQVRIDDEPASQTALGEILRMTWLTPAMDRLWIEGASERRRFLDRATLAFEPAHGERAAAYERAMRERNRLLKEGGAPGAWLDALEERMAEAGALMARARAALIARWEAAQAEAESAFPTAGLSLEEADESRIAGLEGDWTASAFSAALARGRGRDAAAGRTLVGPHRVDLAATYLAKGVEAKLCSTGEQKALLISLTLATARALAAETGSPPILLLDEVAAHLDAGRRAALFDEICALGAQAWMTGTGPELFEALGDRALDLAL
ncbi:MAG: DNA replication/repair protein RecF [Pseudomonadota bacterium]